MGISLSDSGRYSAHANQCMGDSGRGWGTWEESEGFLIFHPVLRAGDLQDLRILQITNIAGRTYLVKMDRFARGTFAESGPSRANAFKKDDYW